MSLEVSNQLIAFDRFWQEPAKTEYSAYLSVKKLCLFNSLSFYIAFPWATLIDMIRNRENVGKEKSGRRSRREETA